METCFACNSASIMSKNFTTWQALLRLQNILVDCSDGEDSNSEINDAFNKDSKKEVESVSSAEESGVNSSSENDDNDPPNQVQVNQC